MVASPTDDRASAYPEGTMLAILFGNCCAPLIDWFVVQSNIRRREQRLAAK
jgi:Na+-transporting NADH:ubiquinone oxidoreductase subunit B